jgi:small-conductance mechanosensitive channel
MSNSSFFEGLLDRNWEIATGTVVAVLALIVATRCFGERSIIRHFPRTAACVGLILAPLTVMVVGSVTRVLLAKSGITEFDDEIRLVVAIGVYLTIAWFLARIVELWILSRSKEGLATALPGLQRSLLYALALVLGLFAFLTIGGHSITGVFISTGAVAAIVAFAMQRTLGDLFSGIALSIERPFRIGDWIVLSDEAEGQVIDINWRATRLREWDNATFVIPNGELARQGFKNLHGSDHLFAPWYEIKIPAEVDPRFAKALLLEAVLRCDKVLKHPLPVVRLMDASTVPYTYMIWVHFPNYPAMFAGREELHREVHYVLSRAGVQTAPDIHEIHARKAEIPRVEPPTTLLALKGLDVASSLTEEELEKIASMSQHFIFDAGTVLLHEGATANAFDVIINGIVESSITLPNGSRKSIERLSPGQYFGITSMITTVPSVLQFTALTDVSLIRIDTACLRSVLADRPDLSEDFAKIVKQRLERAEEVRLGAQRSPAKLTLQDILRRIELMLREPKRH